MEFRVQHAEFSIQAQVEEERNLAVDAALAHWESPQLWICTVEGFRVQGLAFCPHQHIVNPDSHGDQSYERCLLP